MRGFTAKSLQNGAKIEFDTQVFSIETSDGKIVGVETNKGRIECEKVVLATGARARELAQTAEIDLPVKPQKRQIVWAKSRNNLPEKSADGD